MKTTIATDGTGTGRLLVVLAFLGMSTALLADDLAGADRFVCAPAQVNICLEDGSCVSAMPWDVNVPQFLEIDLKRKSIATTEASGEDRVTPIQSISEDDDAVFLQGVENGRAFSFVISRSSGFMSVAVAREFLTVTGFGACTPTK